MLIKAIDGPHKGTVFEVPDSCIEMGIYETLVPSLRPLRFSVHNKDMPARPVPIDCVMYYVNKVSKYSYVLSEKPQC